MEFYNKLIINVDHILIIGTSGTSILFVTEPLAVYEPLPVYVHSTYIQLNLS